MQGQRLVLLTKFRWRFFDTVGFVYVCLVWSGGTAMGDDMIQAFFWFSGGGPRWARCLGALRRYGSAMGYIRRLSELSAATFFLTIFVAVQITA